MFAQSGIRQFLNFFLLFLGLGYLFFKVMGYWGGAPDAGFSYTWHWADLWQFIARRDNAGALVPGLLLQGLVTTLRLSFWSALLAGALGLFFCVCRCLPLLFTRLLAVAYVGIARNIPPLVLVFIVHFFILGMFEPYIPWERVTHYLGMLPGLGLLLPLDASFGFFFSAVLALGLYEGAYMAEIARAGIESVQPGQWEAAAALGLARGTQIFSVVLPQAFRLMLPPLVSQTVSLVKDTSIVAVISVHELTFMGRQLIDSTSLVFEIWISVCLTYLAVCLCVSALGLALERRIRWRLV